MKHSKFEFRPKTGEIISKWHDDDNRKHKMAVAEVDSYGPDSVSRARYLQIGNLLAAAPDLLSACEHAVDLFCSGPVDFEQEKHVRQMIEDAIKKAKGDR